MAALPATNRVLTSNGRAFIALTSGSYLAGWVLGWPELMIVAAGGALTLTLAVLVVFGRQRLSVERRLEHHRVSVGDSVNATIVVTNNGGPQASPSTVEERVGDGVIELPIHCLAAGEQSVHHIELPTTKRGVVDIGPTSVGKRDPFNLLHRVAAQTPVEQLWIRPRLVPLTPVPIGRARDIEGATSDSSPAGDISFHTLRDYQIGDDPRHVHWLSSARAGTLMIRHYVDNRVPELAVVLDTRARAWTGDRFDLAADIAASVVVGSLAGHLPSTLHSGSESQGDRADLARPAPSQPTSDDVLNALTLVEPRSDREVPVLTDQIDQTTAAHPSCSLIVAITGECDEVELVNLRRRADTASLLLIRVVDIEQRHDTTRAPDAEHGSSMSNPRFTQLEVSSLNQFQVAWNREMS